MNIYLLLGLYLLWAAVGFVSFCYWWTKDTDLTRQDIAGGIFAGLVFGPVAFIVGWMIHGGSRDKVLWKQRK
jgi:hypothetical protein